jgi:SAM-dependent methyltransferase
MRRAADVVAIARGDVPIETRVLALAPWYQRIELPGGVPTSLLEHSNVRRWQRLEPAFPDVRGRRVLDVGANAGFFSLKCLERAASRVVALDRSPLACAQARFVAEQLGVGALEVVEGGLEAVAGQRFDLWLLLAVLHHHADIEPILRACAGQGAELLLEWHVRRTPYHHPIEAVVATLGRVGYDADVLETGERPILLARRRPLGRLQ